MGPALSQPCVCPVKNRHSPTSPETFPVHLSVRCLSSLMALSFPAGPGHLHHADQDASCEDSRRDTSSPRGPPAPQHGGAEGRAGDLQLAGPGGHWTHRRRSTCQKGDICSGPAGLWGALLRCPPQWDSSFPSLSPNFVLGFNHVINSPGVAAHPGGAQGCVLMRRDAG